jgi:hypothetical protein
MNSPRADCNIPGCGWDIPKPLSSACTDEIESSLEISSSASDSPADSSGTVIVTPAVSITEVNASGLISKLKTGGRKVSVEQMCQQERLSAYVWCVQVVFLVISGSNTTSAESKKRLTFSTHDFRAKTNYVPILQRMLVLLYVLAVYEGAVA